MSAEKKATLLVRSCVCLVSRMEQDTIIVASSVLQKTEQQSTQSTVQYTNCNINKERRKEGDAFGTELRLFSESNGTRYCTVLYVGMEGINTVEMVGFSFCDESLVVALFYLRRR
jgi:hypothetical protein